MIYIRGQDSRFMSSHVKETSAIKLGSPGEMTEMTDQSVVMRSHIMFYYSWQSAIFLREIHKIKIFSNYCINWSKCCHLVSASLSAPIIGDMFGVIREIHKAENSSNTSLCSDEFSDYCLDWSKCCHLVSSSLSAPVIRDMFGVIREIHKTEISSNTS